MRFVKLLSALVVVLLVTGVLGLGAALYGFWYFGRDLPDYAQLEAYEPPVMTRVHAASGELIAEYYRQERLFVPIEAIPRHVQQAFISAEDKTFYHHFGLDLTGIMRAVVVNLKNFGQRRPVGASTITQQVAKNMLLTNEVSLERKAKEAILALRIERRLSKDRILELYLNEIYLGLGSYGVAAAALNYFDKPLNQLTVEEAAYLAALPKAPNNYHPYRRKAQAIDRRNWVLSRMREDGYIDAATYREKIALPLGVVPSASKEVFKADWFVEEVRRELFKIYGVDTLYDGGLSVRTTLDLGLQSMAEKALRDGLMAYDRRHGWRGPIAGIDAGEGWAERLQAVERPEALLDDWRLAAVLDVKPSAVEIGFADGEKGRIPLAALEWARPWIEGQYLGPRVEAASDVLKTGDVVAVSAREQEDGEAGDYDLMQVPEVNGAIVVLDPHTGRVLSLVGGWRYGSSEFNRAMQATRQPGSAFKPFVYATALDNGYTPSDNILDAPFVMEQPDGTLWKPSNYGNRFYGPSTLRLGIEKSRNLMTVRLARSVGMDKVSAYAERFGVYDHLPEVLSMALGAGETTLMRLAVGYAELVNGGKRIQSSLIDRVQDRRGHTIYRHDTRPCPNCRAASWHGQLPPEIPDEREQILDPATAYQVVSLLQGVIERGTGVRISRQIDKPLGGKTGTTNESNDTWFMGFSPDLVAGVYVGFDQPKTLGNHETGSSVAAPVFADFMQAALADKPAVPFRIPDGVRLVRVDHETGLPARPGARNVIMEAFKPGTEPRHTRSVLDGSDNRPARSRPAERQGESVRAPATIPSDGGLTGTGGLY